MKFSFKAIPVSLYGAIAAALLLLAWSVDNLVQKRIAHTRSVLSNFKTAQLQANYQRATLHYIADIRSALAELTPAYPRDTALDTAIPMEFQSLDSGRLKLATDATLRMQDFALAGEIQAEIFAEVSLPEDIRSGLEGAVSGWRNYTSSLSRKLGEINDFARSVMLRRYGGVPPTFEQFRASKQTDHVEPTSEDVQRLDTLFDEFWSLHKKGFSGEWESRLNDATNRVAAHVFRQTKRLELISNMLSAIYIGLFVLGSVLSIIAAISRGAAR